MRGAETTTYSTFTVPAAASSARTVPALASNFAQWPHRGSTYTVTVCEAFASPTTIFVPSTAAGRPESASARSAAPAVTAAAAGAPSCEQPTAARPMRPAETAAATTRRVLRTGIGESFRSNEIRTWRTPGAPVTRTLEPRPGPVGESPPNGLYPQDQGPG